LLDLRIYGSLIGQDCWDTRKLESDKEVQSIEDLIIHIMLQRPQRRVMLQFYYVDWCNRWKIVGIVAKD
jgi:hypothetical protein